MALVIDKNSLEWSGEIEQFRAALFSSGSSGDCDLVKSSFQITKSGSSILALEQLFLTADQARRLYDNLPSPVAAKVGNLQLKRLANKPCEEAPSATGVSKRSLRRLGRGAFGRVFGVHIKGRLVAVKDVRNVDSPCEKNASQLVHRHVVRTLYVTSLEPRRFLVVMEYGGPRTLEHILEQGPLRLQETLRGPAPRLKTRATQVSAGILAADLRVPSPQQEQHAALLGKGGPAIAVPTLPFKTLAQVLVMAADWDPAEQTLLGQQASLPMGSGEHWRYLVCPLIDFRFGRQTASALHYCHRCNVLHLDVKPSNILVHNADCKLADFGSSAIRGTKPKAREDT
ncbi:hypothetical protein HPB47_020442 [Ixodes persulcatus]|uniref:Uncharacterized protein n=1 Tax=Ixodes persulcatus TaxID=34615 RepID=A0AC60QHF4_IXOPE|nr:hypothetical protein HPB47_020442 [Ixodes persulcatus]